MSPSTGTGPLASESSDSLLEQQGRGLSQQMAVTSLTGGVCVREDGGEGGERGGGRTFDTVALARSLLIDGRNTALRDAASLTY